MKVCASKLALQQKQEVVKWQLINLPDVPLCSTQKTGS
jgi:hypothetical protein